jgi:uncharacterized protein involved in exopolysaccharide biosynthesis
MHQEFSPKNEILHMLRSWWMIVICMVLGGLVGFAFNYVQKPSYQAKATVFTVIDYQKINDVRLTEYDEDMTINSVQSVMLSNDVIGSLILEMAESGNSLDYTTFVDHMSIFRKFTDYELFYRDSDPQVARLVVNTWADIGTHKYQGLQQSGSLPVYIEVIPGSYAGLPTKPVQQHMNTHVLAGAIMGLFVGVIISSIRKISINGEKPSSADIPDN